MKLVYSFSSKTYTSTKRVDFEFVNLRIRCSKYKNIRNK